MKLKISNVAKIEKATLNIDGITVIAGENNTGKSTIGKVLFTIFNSMNNMDEKIEQEKKNRIYRIISALLQNRYLQKETRYAERRRNPNFIARRLTESLYEYIGDEEFELEHFLRKYIHGVGIFGEVEDEDEFVKECANKLETIINVSNKKAMSEVITRWFNRVFEDQMSPLMNEEVESKIELTIKNIETAYILKKNGCIDWKSDIDILHTAFYIDNPFVIDKISDRFGSFKITESHLLDYLCKEKEDIFEGVFDAVVAKDRLNEIYNLLGEIVDGDISKNQNGEYCLKLEECVNPLFMKNLSTGLKSFALIKMLLENGSIKEKDVLILDEPEIHLHPEWQLAYAKLIVLLQKEFDLTMVITTHSPYFLDAIDVFSTKYGLNDKVNYYLAENAGKVSCLRDVTNNIDVIYKKLSDPMQELENIRNGL